MAHDVFVSYSQKDKPTADAVVAGLEQGGIRCWVAPRDILAGTSWGESIVNAIAASRAMVLVLSAEANASAQVIREVELAVAGGVVVVPFRIEEIKPTGAMAYFLAPQHWLDALTPPLKGHIDRLRTTLVTLLQVGAVAEAEGPGPASVPAVLPARRSSRVVPWFRRPLVWAAAALVVTAAVVVPLVVLWGGGEEPATTLAVSTTLPTSTSAPPTTATLLTTTTTAPTTTVAETTTTTAPPMTMPADTGLIWAKLPQEETPAIYSSVATCYGCAVLGELTIRVGNTEPETGAGHLDAHVGGSFDLMNWFGLADFGGPGNQGMTAVVAGGPGLVAVGWDDPTATLPYPPNGGHESGDADAAVWTSTDGTTWERVPHDEAVFGGPGDQMMTAVAAGGPGLVAVGLSLPDDRFDAAVWTSTDGLVWERVPQDETLFDMSIMHAVATGGPGLVATGYTTLRGGADAEVWTSTDGFVWERVPLQASLGDGFASQTVMQALVAAGPRLVAAGYDDSGGDHDLAVWTSTDGIMWERVPHDEAIFGGPGREDVAFMGKDSSGLIIQAWGEEAWVSPPPG